LHYDINNLKCIIVLEFKNNLFYQQYISNLKNINNDFSKLQNIENNI